MQIPVQSLPFYENNYASFDGWRTFVSKHYLFHVFSNSIAEKNIGLIRERQEQAWKKIVTTLDLEQPIETILYYLYPDKTTKERLMGDDGNAQAIWRDHSIHVVYNEKVKPLGEHEDTHILTLPWGVSTGFLQEGLAEWLHGCVWNGMDSAEALRGQRKPELMDTLSHKGWIQACDEYEGKGTVPFSRKSTGPHDPLVNAATFSGRGFFIAIHILTNDL